jgi:alkanesulfonate monooxygenase SsuD/methylene tetrahydromethanopterin reductase-like flavin-dependent oxidoreductase (luciferase family)
MHAGITLFFNNFYDWPRYLAREFDRPPETSDAQILVQNLALGDMAEPLGFDSIWTVEHHFTPYTMNTNPVQILTYFAGRTKRVDMGTMVIVLPWHHPLRVAEDIVFLDHVLNGRRLYIGLGRGTSQKEFDPFGIRQEDSREMFLESLDILRLALTKKEGFSYDGKHWTIPETSIRPMPRSDDILERLYCSWGSPQTLPIAANAGLGMLFIPQKPWDEYRKDMLEFNEIRASAGWPPIQPIVLGWVYCSEDPMEAQATAWTHMGNVWEGAAIHYGYASPDAFKNVKGYEHYQKLAEERAQLDPADVNARFAGTQIYGTPEQCIERIEAIQRTTNMSTFIGCFGYGGLPQEKAERSMRLFAEKVLPALHAMETSPVLASR